MRRADRAMLAALDAHAQKRRETWSDLEAEFWNRFLQFAPSAPSPEHNVKGVIPNRKHEVDFIWRAQKVIVEMEGGVWLGKKGGHTSGGGYESNCEKYNLLTVAGWRVLRFTRGMIRRDPIGCIALVQSLVDPLPFTAAPSGEGEEK